MSHDDHSTLLRERLHRAADDITLDAPGPDRAVARARSRRRNRQGAVAGLGAVMLLAAGVVVLDDQGGRTTVATEPDAPAARPVDLVWRLTPDGLSNVRASSIDPATGATYALSTAPGVRDTTDTVHRVDTLYRLGDDGTWEPTTVGDESGAPARLAADGGVLYGIGTSARDAGGLATVVSTSADGGATWDDHVLRQVEAPNDTLPWRRLDTLGIAAAGGRQVAVATSAFFLDWNEVTGERPGNSWIRGDIGVDGVQLVRETSVEDRDTVEEDLDFLSWDELDVAGPEVFERTTEVFVREGDGWSPVDTGLDDAHLTSLRATGGRFVLQSYQEPDDPDHPWTERAHVSQDGRRWSEVLGPGGSGALPVGDRFAGHDPADGGLVETSGDGSWTDVDLGAVDERLAGGHVGSLTSGDLGLALTVQGGSDGSEMHLVFTPDLRSWTVVPMVDVLGEDAPWPNLIEVGADRIVVIGSDNGVGDGPPRTVTAVGVPRR